MHLAPPSSQQGPTAQHHHPCLTRLCDPLIETPAPSPPFPSPSLQYRECLSETLILAVEEYSVLLYGGGTPLVPSAKYSHGSMVDVSGAAYEGSAFTSLLFTTTACLRLGGPNQPPCPAVGAPLYPQTHQVGVYLR